MGDMTDDIMMRGDRDDESMREDREEEWKSGEHTTSGGKTIKLSEMATPHLINTLNKFEHEGFDVSALQAELDKRSNQNG